jgi:hypothetical protein
MHARQNVQRVIEIALALAEIVKVELVDCARAKRPGMAEIPLLRACLEERAKTRKIRAGGLECGKGIDGVVVLEIVVGGELL